jgi:hypothetical protein
VQAELHAKGKTRHGITKADLEHIGKSAFCRMYNWSLVAPPFAADACSPSGGQEEDCALMRNPPLSVDRELIERTFRMTFEANKDGDQDQGLSNDRRQFLDKAGRFVLATPPAITLLMTSGGTSPAWASGGKGNNGFGNGGLDGSPNGKQDVTR